MKCEYYECDKEATVIVGELYEEGDPPRLVDAFVLCVCPDHRPTCVGGQANQLWNEGRRHLIRVISTGTRDPNDFTQILD